MRRSTLIGATALATCGIPGLVHAACTVTPAGALPLQVICDPGAGETMGITPSNGVFIRSGTVSSINQGSNPAYFEMTGGTLGELNQGGSLDILLMTGGHLTGTVSAGDFADMRGGRVGAFNL